MSSTRQPPMGTPQLATHAGLTPQMSIVDANGRPTMFFFRWLLTIGGAALTSDDSSILESFDPGADAALAESAIADALDAAGLAAGFEDSGAARAELLARLDELALAGALRSGGWPGAGPSADQRALEALSGEALSGAPYDPAGDSDQRALEALMMADAPAAVATPIAFLADTLANWTLANYNPASYAKGQQFVVTDWQVTYAVEAGVWRYIAGVAIAPAASRPAIAFNGAVLGAADAGLRFIASDTGVYEYWNGAAWIVIAGGAAAVTTPFTPELVFGFGGSGAGITYSLQTGFSTVVDRLVTVNVSIVLTSKGATTGTAYIYGLPVIPGINSAGAIVYAGMTGISSPVVQAPQGYPLLSLCNGSATDIVGMTDANFTNASNLQICVSYIA